MTSAFERLGACTPVNRQAGLAIARGTDNEAPRKTGTVLHWSAPPRLRPVPDLMPDLTGRRYGRLTVFGLMADTEGGKARWVVRCDCGDYEPRASRTVSRGDPSDACINCNRQMALRHRANVIQYGVRAAEAIQAEERERQAPSAPARKPAAPERTARGPGEPTDAPAITGKRRLAQGFAHFRSGGTSAGEAASPIGPAGTATPKAATAPGIDTAADVGSANASTARPVPTPPREVRPRTSVPRETTARIAFVTHAAMKAAIREFVATGIKGIDLANRMETRYPLGRDLATHLLRGMVDEGEVVEVECFVPDGVQFGGAYVGSFYLPAGGRVAAPGTGPAKAEPGAR